MQVSISQITNGWVVTILMPNQGQSSIYVQTFKDALTELDRLWEAAQEANKPSTSGIHIPGQKIS